MDESEEEKIVETTAEAEERVEEEAKEEATGELTPEEAEAKMKENFEKAGKIASEVVSASKKLIMVGESVLDIAESIEKMIEDTGAKPAFPANVCINDTAAHFTPPYDCPILIGEANIVKIDIGVHVDGCIGDTAYTVDLGGENGKLVEASENALNAAIGTMKAGVSVGRVGEAIEGEITKLGLKPIENLTGHLIRPYNLHAGVEIPNVKMEGGYELVEGDVFGVEPFATTGEGRVRDAQQIEIFSLETPKNVRMRQSRKVLGHVIERYFTLPFAERWLHKDFPSDILLKTALKELVNAEVFRPYPVLKEVGKGLISQHEHTVVVEKDGVKVLTK